jgi:[ribosomal protein S18]-alanine N-acetyltransferase
VKGERILDLDWMIAMTVDPPVTLARPGDATAIAVLSRDLIEYGFDWRWRPERIARAIRDPNTNVAVVRRQDELAGFGIMKYADDDAHLLLFAVATAWQRQGIGSDILRWLEGAARAAGVRWIVVEARRENAAARCFYNEHGYHERLIERRMYSAAVDGVRLEKWLRSPVGRE